MVFIVTLSVNSTLVAMLALLSSHDKVDAKRRGALAPVGVRLKLQVP